MRGTPPASANGVPLMRCVSTMVASREGAYGRAGRGDHGPICLPASGDLLVSQPHVRLSRFKARLSSSFLFSTARVFVGCGVPSFVTPVRTVMSIYYILVSRLNRLLCKSAVPALLRLYCTTFCADESDFRVRVMSVTQQLLYPCRVRTYC